MIKLQENPNSIDFIRDVAVYFMDFLETDFHKRKLPKRSIKTRNSDNLLVGLSLQKYPSFKRIVFGLIKDGFKKDMKITIEKGVHKTSLPKSLLELIKLQVGKINSAELSATLEKISKEVEKLGTLHAEEYDVALTKSIEVATTLVRGGLVQPFVNQIEKPLLNLELGNEENLFSVEEELSAVLIRQLENKISEVLNLFLAKEKVNILKELKSVFPLSDIKSSILTFFENLKVADLFSEIFEMDRNKDILDKQEFYLYFGEISYAGNKYPIFYLPFSVMRHEEVFDIDFDSQIYVNKKAIEFLGHEYNVQKGTKGNLKTVSERIIYLGSGKDGIQDYFHSVLSELTNFFDLSGEVDFLSKDHKIAKGQLVRITNATFVNLFDKSDEALVNDYEEILQQLAQGEGPLAGIFRIFIDDFIEKNPIPFNPEVEDEWDNTQTSDRLVPSSPIPLNSEQLQILSAMRKDECKYIIVQGPPGTGKSHTITAIVFDAILKNRSVLVLSDKKEALDVVEEKITQTMNKVRFDQNFQNPILRLGKTGSTYGSILAKNTIENIKVHFRATKKDYDAIEQNIEKLKNSLKEDLEAEILSYDDVDINEIHELFDLEPGIARFEGAVDIVELLGRPDGATELASIRELTSSITSTLSAPRIQEVFGIFGQETYAPTDITKLRKVFGSISSVPLIMEKVRSVYPSADHRLRSFRKLSSSDITKLDTFLGDYQALKSWLFGYFFSKKGIEELNLRFNKSFPLNGFSEPHEQLHDIQVVRDILAYITQLGADFDLATRNKIDFVTICHRSLVDNEFAEGVQQAHSMGENVEFLIEALNPIPLTAGKAGISLQRPSSFTKNKILEINDDDFDKLLRYIGLKQKLDTAFENIPELNYAARKKNLEDLITAQATYLLDGRLIDFYEHSRNDAEALRNIIRTKQRFPKNEFRKLKEAFPCILAGIRDYAEYIPLEPEVFDLVIIDEASQVSVAQAFPALLRAKKVLILGDKKQFSNIKAAQARSDTNREYLNSLSESFRRNISTDTTKMVRLGKFNIKTSILEFFEFISNYNIPLLKHFRGYKEIISYSNKFFYEGSLQVMKIRGKSVDEVIKFTITEPDDNNVPYQNTNIGEVNFIISELRHLRDADRADSVGIITPHTNQQKLLMERIAKLPERDYYFEKLKLKIMTFDTCQGEERDIIYYSMVASAQSDRLWGVFIRNLNDVDVEEDGQIKAQRLNVGFSRARETMHFVLSKPIDDFTGSIGDALRHYHFILGEAKKEHGIEVVDAKSKMEPVVMNWFYQTRFWNEHKDSDSIVFQPQFELGKYLRQLDHTYSHPAYKVDFLLIYRDESHREHKIIIEYDGFREHFKVIDEINECNYQHYFSDGDVYRQKVLESYGYKFLRINKFNAGEHPVATLDKRLGDLVKVYPSGNPLLMNIHETVSSLQNGEMKECPKCKEVRHLAEFKDSALLTGYGRFCSFCKGIKFQAARDGQKTPPILSDQACPSCGAKMVLRSGRREKFYGCSKFPYCKGTRDHK